jgi:hypothetical protein
MMFIETHAKPKAPMFKGGALLDYIWKETAPRLRHMLRNLGKGMQLLN